MVAQVGSALAGFHDIYLRPVTGDVTYTTKVFKQTSVVAKKFFNSPLAGKFAAAFSIAHAQNSIGSMTKDFRNGIEHVWNNRKFAAVKTLTGAVAQTYDLMDFLRMVGVCTQIFLGATAPYISMLIGGCCAVNSFMKVYYENIPVVNHKEGSTVLQDEVQKLNAQYANPNDHVDENAALWIHTGKLISNVAYTLIGLTVFSNGLLNQGQFVRAPLFVTKSIDLLFKNMISLNLATIAGKYIQNFYQPVKVR